MAKTHGPQHFDSVREKLRPKHQVLTLKCYPRLPKNSSADVKPNSSELSYLVYYLSHKEVKLPKVGTFIQKRTAKEVYNNSSARVLVTLQILTTLLHNPKVGTGSALALFAPFVLSTITEILKNTNDIGLIEGTLATWDALCKNQDQTLLAADHEYREHFENVITLYANFAQKSGAKKLGKATTPVAVQDAIRLREAGLGAIKSVLLSDALAFQGGKQVLNLVIPAILGNLRTDDAMYLDHLVRLSKKSEGEEKDKAMNRRQSMATVRTFTGTTEASVEIDPRQAEGTAQDADKLAEEEAALLALDCLKAVFSTDQRAQVRSATSAILSYLSNLQYQRPQTASEKSVASPGAKSWSIMIFQVCTSWTPVQDRFILLVTAVETMVHLQVKESDLRQHLLFTDLIDNILRSDLNLIGLSIMDVLLGLVQQTLRILQLNPVPSTAAGSGSITPDNQEVRPATSASAGRPSPSDDRVRVIDGLKACIADLGVHVYYTDQISDMISAILLRLKPTPAPTGQQNPLVTALAIEEPKVAVDEVASNVSLPRERSNTTSGFFSFDTARRIALEAVRDILKAANPMRSNASGGVADSRNPVPISIWEGTQWLLRDPAIVVRKAYVDALITWLQLETKRSDARLQEPRSLLKKRNQDAGGATSATGANGVLARRAVSNASAKERPVAGATSNKKHTSTFLQLLHLANYENALQYAASSGQDIALLHRLLTTLVQRLGLNAVQSGLPVIFALQEEIARVEPAIAKVRVGSLVHGYLWTVVEVFNCSKEGGVGMAIMGEISRRKGDRIWTKTIQYPPLDDVSLTLDDSKSINTDPKEELKAFDDREGLIDDICETYSRVLASPPPSAPVSPGRNFPASALDRQGSQSYLTAKRLNDDSQLLGKARNAMMSKWSKEECLASIAAMAPKSISLSDSRSTLRQGISPTAAAAALGNAGAAHRQLLAATSTGVPTPRSGTGPTSAKQNQGQVTHRAQFAVGRRLDSQSPDRRPSYSSAGANGKTNSSAGGRAALGVEDLKKILAGGLVAPLKRGKDGDFDETASDSMMDAGDLNSNDGYATQPITQRGRGSKDVNTLLASIKVESDAERPKVSMGRPPY